MNLHLKEKKILLVGLGRGIGRAIAKAYADEKAQLFILSRDENYLKKTIDSINGTNRHNYLKTELMKSKEPTRISEFLIKQYKYFDIVIHNIGGPFGIRDSLAEIDDWEKVWRLNVGIAIEMNRILIKPMLTRQWGRIIHISSISSRILRGAPQYCCAKAYLNAYIKTMGRSFAKDGIIISGILPGAVEFKDSYWAKTKKLNQEKYYGFLKEHQAIGRMGKPEEIASFAVFLGSEKASFAAGTLIPIDGGNM